VPTILVIGASRGIGLEFTRQYAAAGERVLATHRSPDAAARLQALGALPLPLDVLDPAAIAGLGRRLAGEPLDIAVINAGVYGPRTAGVEPPAADEFDLVMQTNVRAAMQLIPVLADSVAAAHGTIAVLSSRMGSMTLMHSANGWLYRASKAALNSVVRSASIELGTRGIVCLALHPGWVRTDMGGGAADLDVADSVSGLRRVIAGADASASGGFFDDKGERLAW